MALRCYGGHRFTIRDADTSSRHRVTITELERLLDYEIPGQLEVRAEGRESGEDLETAKPVRFEPLFSEIALAPAAKEFSLTASFRGLDCDPVERPFRHHYPFELGIEKRAIPLMDLREMLAEKTLGYSVNVLDKHYADIAFLSGLLHHQRELEPNKELLRQLVEAKLERGRRYAQRGGSFIKARYAALPDFGALRGPLEDPVDHLGRDRFSDDVRWIASTTGQGVITLRQARKYVRGLLVPILFE